MNMNHPFFHIPAYYKEVLLIGNKEEVYRAECTINKFLREESITGQNNFTLSILIPFTFHFDKYSQEITAIKENCNVELQTYDPIPPRKHATAMIIGSWENI